MENEKELPPLDYLDDKIVKTPFRSESWWLVIALGAIFLLQYMELNRLKGEHAKATEVIESLTDRYQQALVDKENLGNLALKVLKFSSDEPFAKEVVEEFLIHSTETPSLGD